jgi:shikimate kinase
MGHIWLIGMMGSGKTSVGRRVADRLDLVFIDSDDAVVSFSGRSIESLFSEGEAVFRAAEHDVIAGIASSGDHIIATGGGAVLDKANVVAMRASGTTILLDADPLTLTDRLAGTEHRPLLSTGGEIATIARDRAAVYRASADVVINTVDRSIGEVADEVVECVRM